MQVIATVWYSMYLLLTPAEAPLLMMLPFQLPQLTITHRTTQIVLLQLLIVSNVMTELIMITMEQPTTQLTSVVVHQQMTQKAHLLLSVRTDKIMIMMDS